MPPETETDALRQEVARLADEVTRLNEHRFVRIHNNLARLMAFQFLRGMMLGLGTALGATALGAALAEQAAGFAVDHAPVGSDRYDGPAYRLAAFLARENLLRLDGIHIDRFGLYGSTLHRDGACHELLETYPLGAAPPASPV